MLHQSRKRSCHLLSGSNTTILKDTCGQPLIGNNFIYLSPSIMLKKPSQSVGAPSQQNTMTQAQAMSMDLEFLNVREVAEWLRISRISIYRMVGRRILSFYRVGNKNLIAKKDVVEYLEKNRYGSQEG
jgi:excisionase family DNA binding protein